MAQQRLPTLPEIKQSVDGLLSMVLVNFAKMGVHPLMVKVIGETMSKIELDRKYTPEEWSKLLDEASTKMLEDITLLELRSSIAN